jgi:NAD(P)-dependent dehydrogenase (short-subunit alcohol dehydrogenase family)
MNIKDKVVAVTGGARGIGKAIATAFASNGARIALIDLGSADLDAARAELEGQGGAVRTYVANVAKEDQVVAALDRIVADFGQLDVMVNNAGIIKDGLLVKVKDGAVVGKMGLDQWQAVIDVNLTGVFLGCKYGIPALLRAGGGSIINTASFVAVVGAATSQIAYTASKGGVLAMTREIAVEYARRGIRATALCPGPVNTPLLEELLSDPAARARRMVHIPMGRLAEASDIAGAALFLASDDSAYVNGATFLVDGGITAAYVTPE